MTAPADLGAPPLWQFHLPGKHDQSTHGHGGGATATQSIRSSYGREQGLRPRPKGLTPDEIERGETGLFAYQGGNYRAINAHMRGGGGTRSTIQDADGMGPVMDASRTTQSLTVYRGIREPESAFAGMGGRFTDDMTGQTLTERSFMSTSMKRRIADDFAVGGGGGVVMEIRLPKGTGALRLGGSRGGGEREVLTQAKLRLKIIQDRGVVDGRRRLVVEAQP